MKIRLVLILLLPLFAVAFIAFQAPMVFSVPDEYEHGGPYPKDVAIRFWIGEDGTAFVNVKVAFRSTRWYFEGWGNLMRVGNDFYGDSYVWVGPLDRVYLDLFGYETHDFNLGHLNEGVYTFTYASWGKPYKSMFFEVGHPADINNDSKVDIRDIVIVAKAFGSIPSSPNWNSAADVYPDGKVDISDISFTTKHFGEAIP